MPAVRAAEPFTLRFTNDVNGLFEHPAGDDSYCGDMEFFALFSV